jgi:thymidylate synthase (FAD)
MGTAPTRKEAQDKVPGPDRSIRPNVKALDDLLGTPLRVLDDGFVCVLDYCGDDATVVQAARSSPGLDAEQVQDDRELMRYLMRHLHAAPFETCEIRFHIRAPADVWSQWTRHGTARLNEFLAPDSPAADAAQRTEPKEGRSQPMETRQESEGVLPGSEREDLFSSEAETQVIDRKVFEERLAREVAKEPARNDLPLSTYTEAYWRTDLHNLLRFLKSHLDPSAQVEMAKYAVVIGEQVVSKWVPLVWDAFLDLERDGLHLSRIEREVAAALIAGSPERARAIAVANGMLKMGKGGGLAPDQERAELEAKLRNLGLKAPWL